MRSFWFFLPVGVLLMTGLLVGCNPQPPSMKNQQTNVKTEDASLGFERSRPPSSATPPRK
jgi:hypothetical protein